MSVSQTDRRGPGKPRALSPEYESMAAALRREGFGVAAIADLFGISASTLQAVLRREQVATSRGRRRLTVTQEEAVRDLHTGGWSQVAIARHFGVHRTTVAATLDRIAPLS